MPSTTKKATKAVLPGLPNVQRRVVNKPSIRTAAIVSQTENDIEAFQAITAQMKVLRDELEAVRGRLIHTMQAEQQRVLYSPDKAFVVSLRERANWTYSDSLQDELDLLKAKQQIEQRKGIAINTPTVYIDGRNSTN